VNPLTLLEKQLAKAEAEIAEAQTEIAHLTLQRDNAMMLLKQEMTASGKIPDPKLRRVIDHQAAR
jgi:hypothetical protein